MAILFAVAVLFLLAYTLAARPLYWLYCDSPQALEVWDAAYAPFLQISTEVNNWFLTYVLSD